MPNTLANQPQIKIPATYMRGGTSKGVFFVLADLPKAAQVAGKVRDELLLRVIGSPDPYGKHTDGMGGGTSSTSKVVILSKSQQKDHDVDYLFGQVAIDKALIDWSGNCGNLTAAVGAFAINNSLIDSNRIPEDGIAEVRIWQANIKKTIIAHIPITQNQVQETGNFELDGVTFPAAEVEIDFMSPVDANESLFPTGNVRDVFDVPDIGSFDATFLNAGIPIMFLKAEDLGYQGTELQDDINSDEHALTKFETIRAYGAIKMGLITDIKEAAQRQHTPKIAFVGQAKSYTASSGKKVNSEDIDLNVRALSMGLLHHAMMGTAAVAIATAAAIPDTILAETIQSNSHNASKNNRSSSVVFGHPSGTLKVGAEVIQNEQHDWQVNKVSMSRSARILMEGWVRIPGDYF